jgi:ribosomal protein S12 methylthiotransferase accessory factor
VTGELVVAFSDGMHRVATLSETLSRIVPLLYEMGITRAADITGLDRIGIPTWCAVRPAALTIQVSNGKGTTHAAAKVSALMEAIELWHAEHPSGNCLRSSVASLVADGVPHLPPSAVPEFRRDCHFTDRTVIDWVAGENLATASPVWVPRCAAVIAEPSFVAYSTNGLASGNNLVEATLHGLYELIERDGVAQLRKRRFALPHRGSRVMDLTTLPVGPVSLLRDRLNMAGTRLTLIRVAGNVPVNIFFAAIVDPHATFACSSVNVGHGCHLSPTIAALRAITEAAQSRLTYIHGSREDLDVESYQFHEAHRRLRGFFDAQVGEMSWSELEDRSNTNLSKDLDLVLGDLRGAGHTQIYRIDLTCRRFGIPVVKLIAPDLMF